MKKYAIIVAGGSGSRMGSAIPKQFLLINEKPVLMHSISRFFYYDKDIEIIVVLPSAQIELWQQLCTQYNFTIKHHIVEVGTERFYSVKNGLDAILDCDGLVAIHDAVRPLVSNKTITEAFNAAASHKSGVPVVAVNDSIRLVEGNQSKALNRTQYKIVQTPQCFNLSALKKAFSKGYNTLFTDDASVFEQAGHSITLTDGNTENIKITTPIDLIIANQLLKEMGLEEV